MICAWMTEEEPTARQKHDHPLRATNDGHLLVEAPSAREGLRSVPAEKPPLLFVDVAMAAENGLQLVPPACEQVPGDARAQSTPASPEPYRTAPSPDPVYLDRLVFKSRGRIIFLPTADVHWIAAQENYVRLATAGESHMLRHTISQLNARLDPARFLRIHRSTIVNLAYVREIRTDNNRGRYTAIMANGQKLSVSRGYRARMMDLMTAARY